MNNLIKQLERAIEKHTHLYYKDPEQAERYTEQVYLIAERLSELGIGGVFCRTATGRLKWFDLDTYQFN